MSPEFIEFLEFSMILGSSIYLAFSLKIFKFEIILKFSILLSILIFGIFVLEIFNFSDLLKFSLFLMSFFLMSLFFPS